MIKRMIPGVFAAALLAAPAMAGEPNTDDPDNPAHVGVWRVSCDHDGNLHGRNFEACGAQVKLRGGELWLTRDPREMVVEVQIEGCKEFTASIDLDVKGMAPEVPERAETLITAVRLSASKAAKGCHRAAPSVEAALVLADVTKVLELTDGLEDFGDDR